jgi:hypothetical protein
MRNRSVRFLSSEERCFAAVLVDITGVFGALFAMRTECCLCGESVEPIDELDQSIDPDDSPSYNLLCPKCGFLFATRPATDKVEQISGS